MASEAGATADVIRTERALSGKTIVRDYAETRQRAKSWNRERRAFLDMPGSPKM